MVCRSVSDRTLKLCEAWQELLPPLHLQIWFCTLWWSLQSKHFRVQVVNNFKLLGISEESHMLNFIWTHSYLYPSIYPSNPSLSIQFDRDVICMIPVSTSPSPKSSFLALLPDGGACRGWKAKGNTHMNIIYVCILIYITVHILYICICICICIYIITIYIYYNISTQ